MILKPLKRTMRRVTFATILIFVSSTCLMLTIMTFLINRYTNKVRSKNIFVDIINSPPPETNTRHEEPALTNDHGSVSLTHSYLKMKPRNDNVSIRNDPHVVCNQRTKIGFLKIHKAASSTVQNVLLRYGINHDLNFILPQKKYENQFFDETGKQSRRPLLRPFKEKWLKSVVWHYDLLQNKSYDIMALHTVWNHEEISRMLGPNAAYVTIVRHPTAVFQSLFTYYNLNRTFKLDLTQYINMLDKSETLHLDRSFYSLGLNQQLYDLGVPAVKLFDIKVAYEMASKLLKNFDLVMIAEQFDESMVLLANLMCWPLEAVASFKNNVFRADKKVNVTEADALILEKWQAAEMNVYRDLRVSFQKRIHDYGSDRMAKEVDKLKTIRQKLKVACNVKEVQFDQKETTPNASKSVPFNPNVIGYTSGNDTHHCQQLVSHEIPLINEARIKQIKRWRKWRHNKPL